MYCSGLSYEFTSLSFDVLGSISFSNFQVTEASKCQLSVFSSEISDLLFTSHFLFYDVLIDASVSPNLVFYN